MTIALRVALLFAALLAIGACQPRLAPPATVPRRVLPGTDGAEHDLAGEARAARLTVLFFSAWSCPCQTVHDARLRELYTRYRPLGVEVFAVDSEAAGSIERDRAEAARRGYAFPVLLDRGGALAREVGAEYATESLVVDRAGIVRYRGGIDSDGTRLHDGARTYLRDAIDDALAGRPIRTAETKALGCALETW